MNAFHYLVKPFNEAKFAEVMASAVRQASKARTDAPSLMITSGGKHILVEPDKIIYAEVFDRKIILHTAEEDIEYYGKMKELAKSPATASTVPTGLILSISPISENTTPPRYFLKKAGR